MTAAPDAAALAGVRVLLLRPREQAAVMADRLAALGADVLCLPTIRLQPRWDDPALAEAQRTFSSVDFCLLTSANAARFFHAWLQSRDLSLDGKQVCVVGEATAAAAAELGIRVDWISPVFTVAEACARLLDEGRVQGKAGCFPVSKIAAPTAESLLRPAGVELLRIDMYDNFPADRDAETTARLLSLAAPVYCLATSGSTVENLSKLLSENELQIVHKRVQFLSIGPVTSVAVRSGGFSLAAEANPHSGSGLIDALLRLIRSRGT